METKFYRVIKPIFKRDPHLKIPEFFTSFFKATRPLDLVYPLNPERLNPRLSIQQGLFLAAGNLTKSFEDNFESLQEDADRDYVWQIIIDISKFDVKKEILRNLYRMNVTRAALFPGLDGFAESLKPMLAFPEILRGRVPFDPRITGVKGRTPCRARP